MQFLIILEEDDSCAGLAYASSLWKSRKRRLRWRTEAVPRGRHVGIDGVTTDRPDDRADDRACTICPEQAIIRHP